MATRIATIGLHLATLATLTLATGACQRQKTAGQGETFVIDCLNPYTPIKSQGHNQTCWIYAMLATIETEHIARGDSVHLSPFYAERKLLEQQTTRNYLTQGHSPFTMRGTAAKLITLIEEEGIVPYDAYHYGERANTNVVARMMRRCVTTCVNTACALPTCQRRTARLLDEQMGPQPYRVFMLGAEYSPQEFARSVCAPDEYEALTSFTHHPFYARFALEIPDNDDLHLFYNIPIDSLVHRVEQAVRQGHGVCWEGDISEPGFNFAQGTATLPPHSDTSQRARQQAFERFTTTDDHCMAIVGLAHDKGGRRYLIMKNSWGTNNTYGGLMYISEDYLRLKTIAIYLPKP